MPKLQNSIIKPRRLNMKKNKNDTPYKTICSLKFDNVHIYAYTMKNYMLPIGFESQILQKYYLPSISMFSKGHTNQ